MRLIGLVEEVPFLKRQTRLVFARSGLADPFSLEDYRALGGLRGLERALALGPGYCCGGEALRVARPRAEQGSRPGSSGRLRRGPGAQRNISCAMPMRATAAPLPTGC